jgi:magnesium chelatase subunit H
MAQIVFLLGFESFNTDLYRQAADLASKRCPQLGIHVFSDRDLAANPDTIAAALEKADVFFASLLFDYDQVLWLRERVEHIPIRLIFESALELMALTRLGKFTLGDKPKGMPKPVKFILSKFSSGNEEDRLAGYLSFLKVGPKLLKFIPARKVQDLRNWLIIYGYWNAGGPENVAALCWYLAEQYLKIPVGDIPPVIETPAMGLLHPDHDGYFETPKAYLDWYLTHSPTSPSPHPSTSPSPHPPTSPHPRIALLLYRKHVITHQPYIPQLIRAFESAGLIPVPIFINGVEGHVAVRDWLTTDYEQAQRQAGHVEFPSLSETSVAVDAIVSTIGFPLVGGPAGSMEAGRQVAVAKRILSAKNVPYFVSAPLLIQDIASWTRQGVGGLQSVVLYALPELDGAIDPVPLGGLVGDKIYLVPERVERLIGRVNAWVSLRRKPVGERKLAVILYGFPPGYGAVGTAALLNVPQSLLRFLHELKDAGYGIGELPADGETLLEWVKAADEAIPGQISGASYAQVPGASSVNHPRSDTTTGTLYLNSPTTIPVRQLDRWLNYIQRRRMENQWGDFARTGIKTFDEDFLLGGVQLGNVWIGVQPPLGIAGDPMRLMFERDLTPHPQYAAFYKWLQNDFQADAVVHFGMHGTVEWLPGSPLGNTGYSWSDILLGNLPNLYIYAANNPSESMLAKRRGYGVLISHNVPPYGRAGLYKELVTLRDLITEYREDPDKNAVLKDAILKTIADSGLDADCPFAGAKQLGIEFTPENARMFSAEVFYRYISTLYDYLQVLENRLFSSGLHMLGSPPSAEALQSYLSAYFGDELKPELIEEISRQKSSSSSSTKIPQSPS